MILDSKCTTPRGMDFSEGLQQRALQGVFVGKMDRPADTWDHPDVTNLKIKMIFMMVMVKNVNRRHKPGNGEIVISVIALLSQIVIREGVGMMT